MKQDAGFWLFIAVLAVLHFLLQVTFSLGGRAPDLLMIAVLLGARPLPGGGAAALGFGLGLLEDAVSLQAFGAAAAAFTVVAYLGSRSRDLFIGESLFFLALYFFVGKWAQVALYYLIAPAVRRGEVLEALLIQAPLDALYAAVAGLVAVALYQLLRR